LGSTQRYISELESGKAKRADERYFDLLARLGIDLTAQTRDEPAIEAVPKATTSDV
jgi:HTH-type transcriptional regulator/antitoxin HipB